MLACDACATTYEVDDVDLTLGVAHCSQCGLVSELRTRVRAQDRPAVPMPHSSRWQVEREEPLRLVLLWRGWSIVFLLFFAVFWNGAIAFMLAGIVATDGLLAALPMVAIPHVWIGAFLGYYVLASLLNTTELTLDDERLVVRHGPMPWFGNRDIPVPEIDQLYVERSGVRVNKQPRWNLCAMGTDGVGRPVVRLLTTEAEGRWLEDRIEKALAIEDRPVVGEVPKAG